MIFQIHPDHGKHIAYHLDEAKVNEENGWKTVSEKEFYGAIKEIDKIESIDDGEVDEFDDVLEEEIPRAVLEDLYKDKFGKKPHHRMADATIKAKLDAGNN